MSSGVGRRLAVSAVLVVLVVAGIGGFAATAPDARAPDVARASLGADGGVARTGGSNVTGRNVTVGVVDVSGFDTDHPAIAGRVVDARAFAPDEGIRNGGRNDHGTAAAAQVARTAPGADLYLASFDTPDGFRSAVAWMVQRDVDVVVAPVGFYGQPGDGSGELARVAARASDRGVVFLAPVGNVGRGHWSGEFDPDRYGRHEFGGDAGNGLRSPGRTRLTLWISWPETAADRDFTVELYARDGDGGRLVARSQPYLADAVPNERIVASVDRRTDYFFVLRGPRDANGTRVDVTSPTHAFEYRRRTGSVLAPASAPSVVAVGAYDTHNHRAEPFSSAGPVAANRTGVDILAPDRFRIRGDPDAFTGSSAATSYTAGVAALVLDANPNLSPSEVERVLERSARNVGPPGVDPVTGHGTVVSEAAVRAARNVTAGS